MSSLALEVEATLRQLDEATGAKFQKLVRDAMDLAQSQATHAAPSPASGLAAMLEEIRDLRRRTSTNVKGSSIAELIDEIRS